MSLIMLLVRADVVKLTEPIATGVGQSRLGAPDGSESVRDGALTLVQLLGCYTIYGIACPFQTIWLSMLRSLARNKCPVVSARSTTGRISSCV